MRKVNNFCNVNTNIKGLIYRNNKAHKPYLIKAAFTLIILFIIICVAYSITSHKVLADGARDLSEDITSIINGIDLTELDDYLNKCGDKFIFKYGDSAKEILTYLINGNADINYSNYLGEIFSVVFSGVKNYIPAFAQVVAISILCAISSDAEGGIISKSTARTIRLACMSLILLLLSTMLYGVVCSSIACINNIKRQIELFTPILVTLSILTGGAEAGAVFTPSALFISQGATEMVVGLIFPATIAVIIINFLSRLNPEITFTGVSALIKSIMKWVIGITVTVFGLFLTVQGSAASLFNGAFFKVTKYLVGNSVPIVGNFLSSGVDMVVMSGSLVKSSLGIMGIFVLIGQLIQPIIMLASFSIILKVTGAIVQPLGEKQLYSMFSDLSKDVDYFIAGILMVAFMYTIFIMSVINSAYALI